MAQCKAQANLLFRCQACPRWRTAHARLQQLRQSWKRARRSSVPRLSAQVGQMQQLRSAARFVQVRAAASRAPGMQEGWLPACKPRRNCLNFPKAAVLQAEWCPPTGRGRNPSMQDWKCQNCVSERCASSSRSVQGSWTWKPRRELRRKSIASREPREPRVSTSTLSWSRGGSDAPGGLQRIQLRGP